MKHAPFAAFVRNAGRSRSERRLRAGLTFAPRNAADARDIARWADDGGPC